MSCFEFRKVDRELVSAFPGWFLFLFFVDIQNFQKEGYFFVRHKIDRHFFDTEHVFDTAGLVFDTF